jgi:hypothetical protein
MVAGSILPVSIHNNKLYFLFGKENPMENSAKGWSDFGGGVEGNENPYKTALREGGEELTGFLGDKHNIKQLLKSGYHKIVYNDYHVHVFFMEYDENLIKYYNYNHDFLWKRLNKNYLNKSRLFEKIKIKWFSENELTTKRSQFRNFYQEIVDKIKEEIPAIRKLGEKWIHKHKKTRKNKKSSNKTRKMKGG